MVFCFKVRLDWLSPKAGKLSLSCYLVHRGKGDSCLFEGYYMNVTDLVKFWTLLTDSTFRMVHYLSEVMARPEINRYNMKIAPTRNFKIYYTKVCWFFILYVGKLTACYINYSRNFRHSQLWVNIETSLKQKITYTWLLLSYDVWRIQVINYISW